MMNLYVIILLYSKGDNQMRIENKSIINQRIQRIKGEIKKSRQSRDTKQLRILYKQLTLSNNKLIATMR